MRVCTSTTRTRQRFATARRGGGAVSGSTLGGIIKYYNWTPNQIYLDLRTAPIGALGSLGAFVETWSIVGEGVSIAWQEGTYVGNVVNYLLETYAPDLYDAIGGTEQEMVNELLAATSWATAGPIQASMAATAQVPSSQTIGMSTANGDYGSTGAWTTYWINTPSDCPRGEKCPPRLSD